MLTATILPILLNAKVITSKNKKTEYTFFNTLENIFKYKINIIMYIISYYILIDSYNSIGSYGVFIAIVSFIFIYIFYPEIYKKHTPSIDSNASTKGLVDIQPNNSMCQKTPLPTAEERANLTCSNETVVPTRTWTEWLLGPDDEDIGGTIAMSGDETVDKLDADKLGANKLGANKLDADKLDANKLDADKLGANKENITSVQQYGGSRSKKNK